MDTRPDERPPVPRVHPLEVPFVWFGLQLIEYAIVVLLINTLIPEEVRDVPLGVGIAISAVLLAGLTVINYRIRRRFIPR